MDPETKPGTTNDNDIAQEQGLPHHVRLPGFITDKEIGLGDLIKRSTSAVGIPPCGDCARRAAALNRWLVFAGRRPK